MENCASRPLLSEAILLVAGVRAASTGKHAATAGKERRRLRSLQLLSTNAVARQTQLDVYLRYKQGDSNKSAAGSQVGWRALVDVAAARPLVGGRGVWFVLCYCAHGNQWAFQDPGWLDYCINRHDHNVVLRIYRCSCFLVIIYSGITPTPMKSVPHVPNAVAHSKTPFPTPNAERHR